MTIPKALVWQRIRALHKKTVSLREDLKAADHDELVKRHDYQALDYNE